jgi:hypothetical protein
LYRVDHELKEFIESGVACLVGTGSAGGRPHLTYGWGPRVAEDGSTVDVFVETARSRSTLSDLAENPRIAMTVAHPVSYRSVQLKGSAVSSGQASDEDLAWVERHRESFLVSTTLVGDPPATIANLWLDDVLRITFAADAAFDQTPGPQAGKPL